MDLLKPLFKAITRWLTHEFPPPDFPLSDIERLSYEIKPADVILIEGRTRVSEVIKQITQSAWKHQGTFRRVNADTTR